LFRLVITALGLWAAATVVPGMAIAGVGSLIVAALLLGLVERHHPADHFDPPPCR